MIALVMALALAAPLPDLSPVDTLPVSAPTTRFGVDGSGYAYDAVSISYPTFTQYGFDCYLPSTPGEKKTVMYGSSTAPASSGPVRVATAGDGVFVPPSSWFSCRDAFADGPQTAQPITALPAGSQNIVVSPDGNRVCGTKKTNAAGEIVTIDCVRRDTGELERWGDSTTWDEALGIAPFELTNPTGQGRPAYSCGGPSCQLVYEGWLGQGLVFGPDSDELFALVWRQTITPGTAGNYGHGFYGWVLSLRPGSVAARAQPPRQLRSAAVDSGLTDARLMVYDPTLDAVLVGPVAGEWSNDIISLGGDGAGNVITGPRGEGGQSFYVLPVHEPGFGTLSLTSAAFERGGKNPGFVTDADGVYLLVDGARFALSYDLDHLDLDGDGLDRAMEADLGTSDWFQSSDRGPTSDASELLLGTDPLDPNDDPGARPVGRDVLTLASLWQFHDPQPDGERLRSFAANGPLCAGGNCWDPNGSVGSYSGELVNPMIGGDGLHLGALAGGAPVIVAIADGARETLAGTGYDTVVALDSERAFGIATDDAAMRVDFLTPDDAEPLFALAGVAMVDDDDTRDQFRGRLKVVGLLHDALLVTVESTWRTVIVALRPGEEPLQLGVPTGFEVVFPDALLRYADGFQWGYASRIDGLGVRSYQMGLWTREVDRVDTTDFRVPFLSDVQAAWGTVFARVFEGARYELVRVAETVEPGEVYLYGDWPEGAGLVRGSLRGGVVPLRVASSRSNPATGLALSPLHHLCVAEPYAGVLRELAPVASGAAPDGEVARYQLPGVKDCAYGDDGSLWALVAPSEQVPNAAAGVWVRPAPGEPLAPNSDVVLDDQPLHFDQRAGFVGIPTVLDRSVACGRMTTRAGDTLVADCVTGQLLWDGQPLALPFTISREAMMVERPDGRIVTTGTSDYLPMVIDLPTLRAFPYGSGDVRSDVALAIVPGGAAVDPWTQRSLPTLQPPQADVGWDPPMADRPEDSLAGEVLVPSDDGCGAAGLSPWLLVVIVLRRRIFGGFSRRIA